MNERSAPKGAPQNVAGQRVQERRYQRSPRAWLEPTEADDASARIAAALVWLTADPPQTEPAVVLLRQAQARLDRALAAA